MKKIIVATEFIDLTVVLICSLVQAGKQRFTFFDLAREMSKYRFFLYGDDMQHCHSRHELKTGVRQALRKLVDSKHLRFSATHHNVYQIIDLSPLESQLGKEPAVFFDNPEGHRKIADMILFRNRKIGFLPKTREQMLETFMRLFDPRQWSALKQRDPNLPWLL